MVFHTKPILISFRKDVFPLSCLGVNVVRATKEELSKGCVLELNNMSLRKYVILLEAQWIILETHAGFSWQNT